LRWLLAELSGTPENSAEFSFGSSPSTPSGILGCQPGIPLIARRAEKG